MAIVTVLPMVRNKAFELLQNEFGSDVQVIFGLPLSENWRSDRMISIGSTEAADVDVDWSALGNYAREERFSVDIQALLVLRDEPSPQKADSELMDIVSRIYRSVNTEKLDLGLASDIVGQAGCSRIEAVVTGCSSQTIPLPDGGHECFASVRLSVSARVNPR